MRVRKGLRCAGELSDGDESDEDESSSSLSSEEEVWEARAQDGRSRYPGGAEVGKDARVGAVKRP